MPTVAVVDDLIYDVGFHRGQDTAFYLRKGYRVVAFEANPDLVLEGSRTFETEIGDGRLEIVEGAISDSSEETIAFYSYSYDRSGYGTTNPDWVERLAGTPTRIEVPVVRLADHLKRTGTPYFAKIDIEGADRLCLEALLSLDARPALLSTESDLADFAHLRADLDILERLGYKRFAAIPQAPIRDSVIQTRTRGGEPFSYSFGPSSGGFGDDIGGWASRAEIERRYRALCRRYRLFGKGPVMRRRRRRAGAIPLVRRLWPGGYDTHAAR
jgi:FkbM family methyltransferase